MKTTQDSSDTLLDRWKNFDLQTLRSEPFIEKEPTVLAFLERIEFFAKTTKKINEAVKASAYLMKKTDDTPSGVGLEALKATPIIGLAVNSLDFIRIPMIYLACKIMGQEVPFTMKNNVKWALGGALLALGITGLLVPPIAGFIAIAIPALILTGSLTTYKLVRDQHKADEKEIPVIDAKIIQAEEELTRIIHEMSSSQDPGLLNEKAEQKKNELKALYNTQEKLKDSQNNFQSLDDAVSFTVPGMMTIGATLSVLAIPAAPFVLIAGGLLGLGYMLTRAVASKLNDHLTSKPNKEVLNIDEKELDTPTVNNNSYASVARSTVSTNIRNPKFSVVRASSQNSNSKAFGEESVLNPDRIKVERVITQFEAKGAVDSLGDTPTQTNFAPRMRL